MSAAMARRWHAGTKAHPWASNRPGTRPGLSCWFGVEPPAGIEPATPSLPWIGRLAPCYATFRQLPRHRQSRSYGATSREQGLPDGTPSARRPRTPRCAHSRRVGQVPADTRSDELEAIGGAGGEPRPEPAEAGSPRPSRWRSAAPPKRSPDPGSTTSPAAVPSRRCGVLLLLRPGGRGWWRGVVEFAHDRLQGRELGLLFA